MAVIGLRLMQETQKVEQCNSSETTVYLQIQPNMATTGMMLAVGTMLPVVWIAMKRKNWTIKVEMKNVGVQSEGSEIWTTKVQNQATYTAIRGTAAGPISDQFPIHDFSHCQRFYTEHSSRNQLKSYGNYGDFRQCCYLWLMA
eukprot:2429062-Amphidinium_carterae.1